jgi:hypothetical protein
MLVMIDPGRLLHRVRVLRPERKRRLRPGAWVRKAGNG